MKMLMDHRGMDTGAIAHLLTLCMLDNYACIFMACCCCLLVFFFFKKVLHYHFIRVSYSLDPDQNQCSVGPDLGPKLFAKVKVINRQQKYPQARKELKLIQSTKYYDPQHKISNNMAF